MIASSLDSMTEMPGAGRVLFEGDLENRLLAVFVDLSGAWFAVSSDDGDGLTGDLLNCDRAVFHRQDLR